MLSIWDTNGDELNKKVLPTTIYTNTSAFIIVCSYDKRESVEFIPILISFIEKNVNSKNTNHLRNIPIIILVNKCDLKYKRQFKFSDVIKKLRGIVSKLCIYEVSAKDNVMIDYVFNQLIKLTIDKMLLPSNESLETTKLNTQEKTNYYNQNNSTNSFYIDKTQDCEKEKRRSECCN